MASRESKKQKILDVVKQNPHGLTISEIAEKAECGRPTARYYLLMLENEKKVWMRQAGPAKVFFPAEGYLLNETKVEE